MRPTADLVPVAGDVTEDWSSLPRAAGFDPDRPTAWLLEGILRYLSGGESDRLLATLSAASAPGSHLVAVYHHGDLAKASRATGDVDDETVATLLRLGRHGPPTDSATWLPPHGWRVDVTTAEAWAARVGRPVLVAMDTARDGIPYYFVDARRA